SPTPARGWIPMPINSRPKPLAEFWVVVRRNSRLPLLVLLFMIAAAAAAPVARVAAQEAAHQEAAGHPEGAEAEHDASWWPTIQRIINFSLLAGGLWYFVRKPV